MIHAFKSRVAVAVFAASSVFAANAAEITGAGASFIYPVMSKWSADYNAATSNKVNYQSIGSGGGIAQIKAKTVDFGSSDAPLKPEELAASGLAQFPSVIGGVVPVVNVAGIAPGALKLDGTVLANIFLGKIKTWNDPAIAALNPGVACRAPRSPSCTVRMVRAPPSTSSTTCPRSARSGRARSVKAPRSSGRPASAARATKALPHT